MTRNIELDMTITGVELTKACSVRPDKDSTEAKTIYVKCSFDGASLRSVFAKALAQEVIRLQNTKLRKEFDSLEDKQEYKIRFAAPMQNTVDPEAAMIASLRAMTPEARAAKLEELLGKIEG